MDRVYFQIFISRHHEKFVTLTYVLNISEFPTVDEPWYHHIHQLPGLKHVSYIDIILFFLYKQLIYRLTSLWQLFSIYLSFKIENHESENTYLISSSITTCWEGSSSCQSYPLFDNVRLPKYTGLPECDWKEDFIESGNNHGDCLHSGYNGFSCHNFVKIFIWTF